MPKGGARTTSGPPPDPNSARSERRGIGADTLVQLPGAGYTGRAPAWPLMRRIVYRWEFEDKHRYQVLDEEATKWIREREIELWRWAWKQPQAAAWAREPWRWHSVAMWVRTAVVCESNEATAADKNSLHRFADDIGLTPAGLRANGWTVALDELAERRPSGAAKKAAAPLPALRLQQ